MDADALRTRLERFGGSEVERRAVARQARDLADDGRYERDAGRPLTAELVVAELADAPDERGGTGDGPADRWNWWLGSLEVAYGGYATFQARRWDDG